MGQHKHETTIFLGLVTSSLRLSFLAIPYLWIWCFLAGCASLGGGDDFQLKENLRIRPNQDFKHYAFETPYFKASHQLAYVTWSLCHNPKQQGVFFLIGQIPTEEQHRGLCLSKLAQSFLKGSFSVVIIPTQDIGEMAKNSHWLTEQITATEAVMQSYASKDTFQIPNRKGLWLKEEASIIGGVIAKKLHKKDPNAIETIIFEQGIYDLNQVAEKSSADDVKKFLANLKKSAEGALDDYSLAYDFEELPHNIILYHGEKNQRIPLQQASEFATALQSSGFSSRFVKIPELADKIDEDARFQILRKVIAVP